MTVNVNARSVLLLNASYEFLKITTIRHAVDLILRDVVVAVDGVAARIRTAKDEFEVPSVIRLKVYTYVPQRNIQPTPRNVKDRDRYTCIYCGSTPGDTKNGKRLTRVDFTVDHIIPKSKGGKDTWGNLACACWRCNNRKANRSPHEAGMKMLWEPKRPRVNYIIAKGKIPEEWRVYLQI
jgi:5-methylcytosine-specific restriction endonuclease McrA